MAVSVLIPAYNEELKIADTVKAALSLPGVGQLVVVDDGSIDDTAEKARRAGAEVISLSRNTGKGYALNQGSKYVDGEFILLLDADVGGTAVEAEKLLEPVVKGKADLTIAIFRLQPGGGFGLVKNLARWGVKKLGGLILNAPLSGQRAMNRQTWMALQPFAAGYGVEVSSCITCGRKGFRVLEVEVDMAHNFTDLSPKGSLHRGRQFCHVAAALAKEAIRVRRE